MTCYALLIPTEDSSRRVVLVEADTREEAVQKWMRGEALPGWGHRPADCLVIVE